MMASQGKILLCLLIVGVLSLVGSAKKSSCNGLLKKYEKKSLANGRVKIHKLSLIYSCKAGYKLINGKAMRPCKDGKINGKLPQCARNVSCGTPFLADGSFSGSEFTVGERITYKCNRGFKMIGGKTISKCKKNGKWSNVKPTCKRIQCPAITKLMNGNVTSTDPHYSAGSKLYFECDDNYEVIGADTLSCLKSGDWDRRKPYCRAIRCPDPGQIPNGLAQGRDFRIGKKVRFSCYAGYKLLGSRERICLKSRRWEGSLAVCDDGNSYCPTLGTPIKGKKQGNQYNLGDVVTFSCEDGYVLRGSAARMCMQNRQWNGTEAFCIDEQEAMFKDQNETALLIRKNFLDTVMEYTCTDDNSTCNGTLPTDFDARARKMEVNARGLDLVFVFDGSSSISKEDFNLGLKFAQDLVKKIGADRRQGLPVARFAAVTYGSTANLEFNLGVAEADSTQKVIDQISKIQRVMGGTATAQVLQMVRKVIVPEGRDGKRFLVFITDGRSNIGGPPGRVANKLQVEDGFEMYVIGVGRNVNSRELYSIASPGEEYVIIVRSFKELQKGLREAIDIQLDYSPCGVSTTPSRARIVGGRESGQGRWPWMVRISGVSNGKRVHYCGAALIRRRWILTAAHCFYTKDKRSQAHKTDSFDIVLGDHDRLKVEQKSEVKTKPDMIVVHPKYDVRNFVNDIALVKLKKKAVLSKFVRSLCLPDEDLVIPGKRGLVAGWGHTEAIDPQNRNPHANFSTVLRESAFTIQENRLCLNKTKHYVNPNVTFCAGHGKGGNDSCGGDSGGPFTQELKVGDNYRWMATGLVSWGEGCAWKDKYGYYTRVLPFVDWINKTITANTLPGDDDDDNGK